MEEKEVKKPSYEELEEKVRAYAGLNNQLYQQIMSVNMNNLYKRLDYLFQVLNVHAKDNSLFDSEFIIECADEIKDIMTPPKKETEE